MSQDTQFATTDLAEHLHNHKPFYLFEGWLLIAIGVLAAILPTVTAITFSVVVAVALLTGGIGRLLTWRRRRLDNTWRIFGGLTYSIAGLLMLFYPMQGVAAFVLLLGAVLIVEGILAVAASFSLSTDTFSGWLMFSGFASLLLGLLVLMFFPEAGMLYLAITVGVSFALTGISLLFLVKESSEYHES